MPKDRSDASTLEITYVGFVVGHGGDALQMLELAKAMRARGATVRMIVPATPESVVFAERAEVAGVPCERSDRIAASMGGARQSLRDMIRLFRSIRSPIVHVHSGNSCLPRTAMLALVLLRFRRGLATMHSPYETIEPGSGRARFWAFAANSRLASVVSPSRHGTEFQRRCGVRNAVATTIPNSVDVSRGRGEAAAPRAEIGVGPDDPIVLFSSRLAGQKRPVDAVRAFAGVAAEFPTSRLVFVGDGDEVGAVREEVARAGLVDRVHLMGYRTDIPNWLAAATVWILPTERENFSIAVLEALAAGCAVLATQCPGNDEVLVDGENSLTFAVGDVESATFALRTLLGNAELRARLGERAALDGRRFSPDAMADRYGALYAGMTTSASQA